MTEKERKVVQIPEITRVEGHSAVAIEIEDGVVTDVKLDVFEGTRFFEQIVLGHKFDELPHITSRVCAICSTGHVLAAIFAVERIFGFAPQPQELMLRELMHLGMIIESHATHICALALPDFLKTPDLVSFATEHKDEFLIWTKLRALGAAVQTLVGGRPFHPVNLHVGGVSKIPDYASLRSLKKDLLDSLQLSITLAELVLTFEPPVRRLTEPEFLCLIPKDKHYGYFGDVIKSTEGWERSIQEYQSYLLEEVVAYSHAKRSTVAGKPIMVGSMARLAMFSDRLEGEAANLYKGSPLAKGDHNTIWNNAAQAIEVVQAIQRAAALVDEIVSIKRKDIPLSARDALKPVAGRGAGAVECPRGTLYHFYEVDEKHSIVKADMITPSAQNTARIELDIKEVVASNAGGDTLMPNLETLVRAYDPCNTCATHMVSVNNKSKIKGDQCSAT
ncbi:MAG: Ni/Fe hydrogenase subunit alpha [Candidatus Melainabacteria bacterium]|nr:Ni/Fe hydrogenase subunit alpha [Candidatus Melainabacteria bacterium]